MPEAIRSRRLPLALAALTFAGLLVALPARRAAAALPILATVEQRLLESDVILVARCTPIADPPLQGDESPGELLARRLEGGHHALAVREVMYDWRRFGALDGYRLNDAIPGSSSVGDRAEVPAGVDLLIFARVDAATKELALAGDFGNAVVPLAGTLHECQADGHFGYELVDFTPEAFVLRVRQEVERYGSFDHLRTAYETVTGSGHPYTVHDRPRLLSKLLALADPRVPAFAAGLEAQAELPAGCREVVEGWRHDHPSAR
jgi:hypothetical protein